MKEKLLHYIWQYKLYKPFGLKTSDNQLIEVIDPGKLNTDAGPDFFNAKLKIEGTLWAGNIEIHVNASDWRKHQHDKNPAYDSVILHVVKKIDAIVCRTNGEKILQAALIYPIEMEQSYNDMLSNSKWIACADKLKTLDSLLIHSCLSAMLSDRLQHKSNNIIRIL
ncbi:MAG: DUF2851 family protein, partial [Vallitaleaceae bacterium]|nr:DUF2851 family protein [Vallitaleaceae bacterium]